MVIIEIDNNGPGMDEATCKRVFQPFSSGRFHKKKKVNSMAFFDNMQLKTKFTIMILVPLVGLAMFGFQNVWLKREVSVNMATIVRLNELVVLSSTLVHETQKERGLTSGFLGSEGKKFRSELRVQRKRTDERILVLRNYLDGIDTEAFGVTFSFSLTGAVGWLDKIASHRLRVDDQAVEVAGGMEFYIRMNAAFLDTTALIGSLTENAKVGVISTAYVNFLKAKERAGIERAVLTNVFVKGGFEPGAYREFGRMVAEQKALFEVFRELATPEQVAFFDDKMASPVVAEVQGMRERAFKGGEADTLYVLLGQLYQNMAIRGIYHSIKNLLIRGSHYGSRNFEPRPEQQRNYKEQFAKNFQAIEAIVARIRALPEVEVSPAQRRDVEIVWANVRAYHKSVDVIITLQNQGKHLMDIDYDKDVGVRIDDQPAYDAVRRLTDSAIVGRFEVDPSHWLNTITGKINLLKEVENRLSADLLRQAKELKIRADAAFWSYLAFTLALIAVVVVMGRQMTRNAENQYRQLETRNQEVKEQIWLKTAASDISSLIQKPSELQPMAQSMISKLTPLIEGGHGVLYVLDDETDRFTLLGSYGYQKRKRVSNAYKVGEGLVGQAALENQTILITEPPEDYIKINSGLGEATPRVILVVPLAHQGKVQAVLEISSFKGFTPVQRALLEELAPTFALSLDNRKRTRQTEQLLQATQHQAAELKLQQEELRQSNDALEKQAQELVSSEEELRVQQEELQSSNERMEEKNRHLEARQKELEENRHELTEQARELKQASKYKTEFLANMSHELRTPLNSMLLLSHGLMENKIGNLTEEQLEDAAVIHSGGTDLLNLINEILDLSKIEAGRTDLFPADMDITAFAGEIERVFKPLAKDKGLAWNVEVAQEIPTHIHTDAARVNQIVKNLLSNSFKFTRAGSVTMRVFRPAADWQSRRAGLYPERTVAIAVADTGIGIPEEKQRMIFEAFQQADGSTSREFGGTGLGLSIAQALANLLCGEIDIQSVMDQGSVFTLYIPEILRGEESAVPVQAPAGQAISDDRGAIQSGDRIMLVIEDDPRFARIVRDLACERGFKCLTAADGKTGLALASRYRPMGIILDIGLPVMDGWNVLERLKQIPETRHIPVHIVSALEENLEGLHMGAVGHIAKPVTREQINEVFTRIEYFSGLDVRNVLLVDNDPGSQQATTRLLENERVEITAAETGEEAFRLLKERKFDCMILDLGLPGISGFELLDQMAAEASIHKPPVVVYTGRELSKDELVKLKGYTDSIVIKGAESSRRLMSEVVLFIHSVDRDLSEEQRDMLQEPRETETVFQDRKVLVVDDDMRNAYALARNLKPAGLAVLLAINGREALKTLDEHPDVDIVLMDIMMPEMDGFQAMREIRRQARFKQLPIIALTAKATIEDREKCLEAGADDYLSKPVKAGKLLSILRIWLHT